MKHLPNYLIKEAQIILQKLQIHTKLQTSILISIMTSEIALTIALSYINTNLTTLELRSHQLSYNLKINKTDVK